MTNRPAAPKVNRALLADGSILEIVDGIRCPHCDSPVRGTDAEPLDPGVRLVCHREHHLVLSFEPAR